MSYKEAPSQLYAEESEWKKSILLEKESYLNIQKDIANKGRIIPSAFVSESQREECLWIQSERSANNFLRDLNVSGNTENEWHSLDDDKD